MLRRFVNPERLPAVPAISAVAAIPTISAAAPTTTMAATTSTATAPASITPAAPAATATFGLWPRFVHNEVPSAKVLAIQRIYRAVRIFVVRKLDESETPRLSRKTITDEIDA